MYVRSYGGHVTQRRGPDSIRVRDSSAKNTLIGHTHAQVNSRAGSLGVRCHPWTGSVPLARPLRAF